MNKSDKKSNSALTEFNANHSLTTSVFKDVSTLIEEKGAVILRNVISSDFAEELKNSLIDCIRQDEQKRGDSHFFYGMVHALLTRDKSFRNLLENEFILNAMRSILGHGAILYANNSTSQPPDGSNFTRDIHVDSPRFIPGYITNVVVTLALDPFTSKNGAMEIWPASFNRSEKPSIEEFEENMIKLDNLNIGDAVLFNARCWHRGGINTTKNWRHAVTMCVCRSYMRQQFDYPKMFTKEQELEFSENLKQFMGYYVRPPKSMEEFLLPEAQRPYRAGQE